RGRGHPHGRRRRARAETSARPFRPEDSYERGRRATAVPGRHDPVQACDPRLPAALPWHRDHRVRGPRLVRLRSLAAHIVGADHGDPGHRRGVGIDFAELARQGVVAMKRFAAVAIVVVALLVTEEALQGYLLGLQPLWTVCDATGGKHATNTFST